ncbi:MAG: nucleotidyltransferase [Roseburia sp.]|nr:nucleotidyltransferase [Roseburia sp.]
MRVNGIIAEYNPFHNGHFYQLSQSRQLTGADYTIIAMSGNFMQRGEPALVDKYVRAKTALLSGADLVLELPGCYSAASAEYFARGGVALLDKLGVVTSLCFGSESGNLDILTSIARILKEEPTEYSIALKQGLQRGMSFPAARNQALLHYQPELLDYETVLATPNNILGIEYIKALLRLESTMEPYTIRRLGADYHDQRFGSSCCSALALRQAILNGQAPERLAGQMPKNSAMLLAELLKSEAPIESNDFSGILHYKLLEEQENGFTEYLDVNQELSNRICKNLYRFNSLKAFCDILKTKDMTYTRVSRCLIHILLDITKEEMRQYISLGDIPYARVLGFRREAQPLLSAIKEKTAIPIITKLADAEKNLSPKAMELLRADIRRSSIYESTAARKSNRPMRNEFQIPLVII